MRLRVTVILAAVALGSVAAWAQSPARDHDVTLDDVFTLAAVTEVAVSPDGAQVAYVDRRWEQPRETRNADLWVVPTAGGNARRLTFEFSDETSPRWSADGAHLFYLASRKRDDGKYPPYNGKNQVWRLAVASGDETPVTRAESGVDAFEVARDGGSVYYTVSKDANDDPWKPLREKHAGLSYGDGKRKVSELWKLDLATWRVERLADPGRYVRSFAVSPDGRRAATVTTEDDELISNEGFSRIDILDLAGGKPLTLKDELWRAQAPSPFGWLTAPSWSSDGARLAFAVSFDGYPTELFVAQWAAGKDEPRIWKLDRAGEVHPEDAPPHWQGDRDLLFVGHKQARRRLYRIHDVDAGKQGEMTEATPGDAVVYAFGVSDGGVAVVKADPSNLPDVFAVTPDGASRRLTEVNPQARRWKLPRVSLVRWTGADGDEVEGVLELPPGAKEGERLPLVLDIHGGPTSATPYCLALSDTAGLLAARGYARLSPNYRGSLGYGDEFLRDLVGRENDIEVKDLLAGVDAMIARGVADKDRLAVAGWSNGGFLTTAVVAADQRFKAASCGAGVVDQFMQWGLEDTPGHVVNFMGGKLPWDAPQTYLKSSPAYALGRIKTPMLIHVGADDERVPAAHARSLYRALRRYLDVPAQLVVYPGEGHSLSKLANRRAKAAWDQAWLDRYVLGKAAE